MLRRTPHIRHALHITALSGFAVAQPLFDPLGNHAAFFVAQGSRRTDILLFSIVILLGPPLLIVAASRLAALLWPPAYLVLHSAAIGGLAGLMAAPAVTRTLDLGPRAWLAIFGGTAVAAVLAYLRWSVFRELLTWAAAAPIVFLAVFLFGSPVRQLLLPAPAAARPATVPAEAAAGPARAERSIVLLIFDELSLGSLLRSDGTIDASRYPNFARLAASSTWYPNATTNAAQTSRGIPALLTGMLPGVDQAPAAILYPDNLFTLVADSYPVHALEFTTRICPDDICGNAPARRSFTSLLADAGVVYLHAVLPGRVARARVPPLAGRWTGFAAPPPATGDPRRWRHPDSESDPLRLAERLVDRIGRAEAPALWYLHAGLPHAPWRYLPTLQIYAGYAMPGLQPGEQWAPSRPAVEHALQRYLLQLQVTDRLLGTVLDRIREADLDDELLLIVTADHGVAFNAGGSRRLLDGRNAAEILPVPLFVRYPAQRHGRVDPRNAELVDILPTIADVLGIDVPWTMDGASLRRDDAERSDKRVVPYNRGDVHLFPNPVEGIGDVSRRIEALFGPGGDEDDLFRLGPYGHLVGRAAGAIAAGAEPVPDAELLLDDPTVYQNVDPQGAFIPALLAGTVTGAVQASTPIAAAVNGSIAGTGWTFEEDGSIEIAVMLSPRHFVPGRNDVEVYRVSSDGGLAHLRRADQLTYRLLADGRGVEASDGRILPFREEGFAGVLDGVGRTDRIVWAAGWAADLARQRTPDAFLVVCRGEVVHVASPSPRPDVAEHFGSDALTSSGLLAHVLPPLVPHDEPLEIYAVFESAAFLVARAVPVDESRES